jgi:hypothetical protein
MGITRREVEVAECDFCGARKYSEEGQRVAGIQGHLTLIDDNGVEKNVKFFSCRTDGAHIGKAAVKALENWQPVVREPTTWNRAAG